MKQLNEKPAEHRNLGTDVLGAARHRNDTYDNPERLREKQQAKANKTASTNLKTAAIASLTADNFVDVILQYEINRALLAFDGFKAPTDVNQAIPELKAFVVAKRGQPDFGVLASKFNRLSNLLRRIRWRIRSLEQAQEYFAPKQRKAFTEVTGVESPWRLNSEADIAAAKEFLAANTKAVQFGNSIPDTEREYCLHHLAEALQIISKHYSIDFKSLAFSFGARGKAGSVAHYEDSSKVLAFNRHRDGSLIHELGHAIDYALGGNIIPRSIKQKYSEKIRANDFLRANYNYYMKNTEIFARMFEAYVRLTMPERTSFMIDGGTADLPDMDAEALEYFVSVIKPLLKGG